MTPQVSNLEPPEQALEFTLGEERYCVGIDQVEEIVRAEELTPLPDSPPEVAGLLNLRGDATTILDLTCVFETTSTAATQQVIVFDGEEGIGWLVDRVHRVTSLRDADVDSAPDALFVSGLLNADDGFVIWLEPAEVNESYGQL